MPVTAIRASSRRRTRRIRASAAAAALLLVAPCGAVPDERRFEPSLPRLADYDGKIVLLHFWATWCDPCTREIPSLAAFYRGAAAEPLREKGLVVLAVSNDVRAGDLEAYLSENPLPFPVYFDPYAELRDQVRLLGVPATAVIGRDGRVVERLFGEQDWQSRQLHARLEQHVSR